MSNLREIAERLTGHLITHYWKTADPILAVPGYAQIVRQEVEASLRRTELRQQRRRYNWDSSHIMAQRREEAAEKAKEEKARFEKEKDDITGLWVWENGNTRYQLVTKETIYGKRLRKVTVDTGFTPPEMGNQPKRLVHRTG